MQETVNSVIKAVDILRCLSRGVDRLSDLCTELHLQKGTVHRLLKTLQLDGMVTQDTLSRRYFLGPLFLEMASRPMIAHQHLLNSASEEMKRLRDLSWETVVLSIRMGLERICLEEMKGLHDIRFTLGEGFVGPIYMGSAGKLLLSEMEDSDLDLLVKNLQLIPLTKSTITDIKQLFKEIEKIRKQGYSLSFGERVPESASISVAVKNYVCPVALTILGPESRLTHDVMMRILKEMKGSAERISRNLAKTA